MASSREWPFNKGVVGLNFNLKSGKRVEKTRPASCLSYLTHREVFEGGGVSFMRLIRCGVCAALTVTCRLDTRPLAIC